jgi:hypothetical protein
MMRRTVSRVLAVGAYSIRASPFDIQRREFGRVVAAARELPGA